MSSFKWDDSKFKKKVIFTTEQKMIKAGFMIANDAKRMVKVDTGRLRSSISVNWTGSGMAEGEIGDKAKPGDGTKQPTSKPDEFTVVAGTNVKYARRLEYGFIGKDKLGRHYNQAARPYLRPALAKNLSKIKRMFKEK